METAPIRDALEAPKESGPDAEKDRRWEGCRQLWCVLNVELPVPAFTVRQLLELQRGSLVDTRWSVASDVPLRVNGELVAWSEFEVTDERYGVRLTELT